MNVPNVFLDRGSRKFYQDWNRAADDMVALLRAEAGRNPTDVALAELVDELATDSEEFRTRWAAHDVLFNRTGVAHLRHKGVGDLTLTYKDLVLPEGPGQTILVFAAEPDSESQDALTRLASWGVAHGPGDREHASQIETYPDQNPPNVNA